MGNCFASSPHSPEAAKRIAWESKRTKEIQSQMERARVSEQQDGGYKLLLLGAGESGKSTLFKQVNVLYGQGYSALERDSWSLVVYQNVITAMKILLDRLQDFEEEPPAGFQDTDFLLENDELNANADEIKDLPVDQEVDAHLADIIGALWKDEGVQSAYKLRSMFQLPDSAKYFFDQIDAIGAEDYTPSVADIVRARVRTTGIIEKKFTFGDAKFNLFDVGGQRNERKKWIHCFDDVDAVIFVASLSGYNEVLYEDETTNRMVESFELFKEVISSRWFRRTSIILFLNKRDLFADKIATIPFTTCPLGTPESTEELKFTGDPNSYDECLQFISSLYEREKRGVDSNYMEPVYTHVTCATDSGNISHVFTAVKDIVIRRSLQAGGLLH